MIIHVAKQYGYREYVDSNSDNKIIGQIGIIVSTAEYVPASERKQVDYLYE